MHDSGPLLPPKEGGPMADLISYVRCAKEYNDEFMTSVIANEKEQQQDQQSSKKPRT